MKILLLGATGRTGKLVLEQALAKGYSVNCLARNSKRIEPKDQLTVLEGSPNSEADLKQAIAGCEAVISVLNISRKSDFPWSGLRTPKTLLSDTIRLILPLAEAQDLKRITICSAWGVAETINDIPWWFKWTIKNIKVAYEDHEKQEQILTQSKVNWTIVRPVGLTNFKRKENIRVTSNNQPKPGILISRLSVAKYLVDSLEDDALINKKVVISKA